MSRLKDMNGQKFGKLTVIKRIGSNEDGRATWLCECECINKTIVTVVGKELRIGHTRSCGCLQKETASKMMKTHGHSNRGEVTPEYTAWQNMRDRCLNPNSEHYDVYGGRGIVVCGRWLHSFENFLNDMGARPFSDYSIDRIDAEGNYSPDNCRWADKNIQARNQRIGKNNKSGVRGVEIVPSGKYKAHIGANYKNIHLGTFDTKAAAIEARLLAELKYWK